MTRTFDVITPVDGCIYATRTYATHKEIETGLSAARQAQAQWKTVSISDRVKFCSRFCDYFENNIEKISEEITWQMGRPISQSPGELNGLRERANYMIGIAEKALEDIQVEGDVNARRFIRREPLGVVLTIAPWNYPYLTAVNSVIPALMAGNAVILKHATQTPLCSEQFAAAFDAAGLPQGLFQPVHLTHEDTESLIARGDVDHVVFTGSVSVGRKLQHLAGQGAIGIGLELGGKDPAYVRHDANLSHAIAQLADGAFFNAGQSCCGIERIYVHNKIYDDFVGGIVDEGKKLTLGSPLEKNTTLGPMVNIKAANFVREQIKQAISQGANTLINRDLFTADNGKTNYMAPQIISNVDHTMSIMMDESFGPVVGIMPVSSDEQAIQLMNDSSFGLTASIWSQDEGAALYVGNKINTGTCFMNRCDYLDPALAWTGVKDSGTGCALSELGYGQLTRPKSFYIN